MNSNLISNKKIDGYQYLNQRNHSFSLTNEELSFFNSHNLLSYAIRNNRSSNNNKQFEEICLINQLQFKKKIKELNAICYLLDSLQVEYRVLKGIGIAMSYPEPYTRIMGDFDILVRINDYERTVNAFIEDGYTKGPETEHDIALVKINKTKIELHFSLFNEEREKYSCELLDHIWENPVILKNGIGLIKTPNHFWHFRYIMLHMMKHLKYRGFGLRFLIDLVHFIKYNNITISDHIHYFQEIGYGKFYITILYVCHKNFELDFIEELLKDINFECVKWLEEYVLESGAFGNYFSNRRVMIQYEQLTGKMDWNNNNFWSYFFPNKELLSEDFYYAKKHFILIPIAWGHRVIKHVKRKDLKISDKYFVFRKYRKEMNDKERMMRYLELWK